MAEVMLQDGETVENALRRFKRKVIQENIIGEVKRHSFYLKPGQKLRVKQALARKRNRKKARREPEQKKRKGTTQKFALYCVVKATRQQWAFSVNMTALLNFRMARDPRGIWLPTLDAFRNLAA